MLGVAPVGQGARTDLESIAAEIASGASMREISTAYAGQFIRYHRGLRAYAALQAPQRSFQTKCVVWWGPPGGGKSYRAFQLDNGEDIFSVMPPRDRKGGAVWWDGYDGHKTVIIDDFYGWLPRDLMYRLVDCHPSATVEPKGTSVPFTSRLVAITSNTPPEWWWKIGLGAMMRRLSAPIGEVHYVPTPEYPTPMSWLRSKVIRQWAPDHITVDSFTSDFKSIAHDVIILPMVDDE